MRIPQLGGGVQSLLPKSSPASSAAHLRTYGDYKGVGGSHLKEIRARSTAEEFARIAKDKAKQMLEDAKGALGLESQSIKEDLKETVKTKYGRVAPH